MNWFNIDITTGYEQKFEEAFNPAEYKEYNKIGYQNDLGKK